MGRKCGKKKTKNGILDDGMDVVENVESCPLTSIESPRSIQSNNNDLPVSKNYSWQDLTWFYW